MNAILTIAWLTFHEARRRRMAVAALGFGALFLLLFGTGFYFIDREIRAEGTPLLIRSQLYTFLTVAGLYVVQFLMVMLSIFASVDTVAGEISSHTVQAILVRPLRRSDLLLGKWLGLALMLLSYLGFLAGGVVGIVFALTSYAPSNLWSALPLMGLESLVLLSLSILGGTRLSALTNGVVQLMLYGLAFIGGWVEQIGSLLQSESAVRFGIIVSLLSPVESLWRRAAYLLQPPISSNFPSPFTTSSLPSEAMVGYAVIYSAVAILLALRWFGRRDL